MSSVYHHFRVFMLISSANLLLFALFSAIVLMQHSPDLNANGAASGIPGKVFVDVVSSQLTSQSQTSSIDGKETARFLFRYVTGIQWGDPSTLLAEGMPHIGEDRAVLVHQAIVKNNQVTPKDYLPPKAALTTSNTDANAPTPTPTPSQAPPIVTKKNLVFIYHSHNRESYLPELKGTSNVNSAFDEKINVTMVGNRLAEKLKAKGIGAVVSKQDYKKSEAAFNYINSYRYSLKTIKQAIATNQDLNYFIDIHRDSQRKPYTTAKINGLNYAQAYFIIGYKNAHWKQNEQLAKKIHQQLEKRYPGLSRGVWGKNTGNAEYNQSVSPNSILIEIGGPENTLQECYRTADVLGDVIAEMIWGSTAKES